MVASFHFLVSCGPVVLADLTMDVDAGATVAEARYGPA